MLFLSKMILTIDLSKIAHSLLKAGGIQRWNLTTFMEGTACQPTCTSREELTKSPRGMGDILALKLPRYLVQSKFTIFSIKIKRH